MTFKEFCDWCNDRACDGFWSSDTAITCCFIVANIRKKPFWKREKIWQRLNREKEIVKYYVERTNERIEVYLNER